MTRQEHLRNLALLGLLALVLVVLPHGLSVYLRSFALFTMMYVVLALSWNIISGFTGYTSFGHVAFYGIGAYACAILVADYSWPWVPTLSRWRVRRRQRSRWPSVIRCCASRARTSPSPCWGRRRAPA